MNITLNKEQMNGLVNEHITFLKSFEQTGVFNEKTTKFWFRYRDIDTGKDFPFQLSAKLGKNWLDEQDPTPILELGFSTVMAENGRFYCMGNDLLKAHKRKQELVPFYFDFEKALLDNLNQSNAVFGYERESNMELFNDFQWFGSGKSLTPSGRKEQVKNMEFKANSIWETEEIYIAKSAVAEGKNARHYVEYFLSHTSCQSVIKEFLSYVLRSGKNIRITRELSFWNYNFLVRPDMLHYDYKTLPKLGYRMQFNHNIAQDKLSAMIFAFDLFSSYGTVNLCLDSKSVKQLNAEWSSNPFENLALLTKEIKKMGEPDEHFERYLKTSNTFLDGLLDLHHKYETMYAMFGDDKYQKRSQKVKALWLKYVR